MRRSLLLAACLSIWTLASLAADGGRDLLTVELAEPSIDHLDEAVQLQVRRVREALDELLEREDVARELLADALGGMGQLYYVNYLPAAAKTCFLNAVQLAPRDFRWHYYLAVIHLEETELEEAESRLRSVLELHPGDQPSLVRLGRLYFDQGRTEAAAAQFEAVLEAEPESAIAHYELGRLAYARRDYAAAIERFQRALQLDPSANAIHHQLGMSYRQLGDLEKAAEHLALNEHDEPRLFDPLLQQLGKLVGAGKVHEEIAKELLREEDFEGAIAQLRLAIQKDPDSFLAHHNLGLALISYGREEEGMRALQAAVKVNPDYANSHFNLGALFAKRGDLERAAYHFGEAHRIDPEDELAHLEWATALERSGEREQALEELEELLELAPRYWRGHLHRGIVLARLGRVEQAEEALRVVLEGDAEQPVKGEAHLQLATLAEGGGDRTAALERTRQAVQESPESVEAHLALANRLARERRYEEAAPAFRRATELEPGEMRAHYGLALTLILDQRYGEAKAALEVGLEALEEGTPLTNLLARLLSACPEAALRDGARAAELARRAFQAQPNMEHAETLAMALAELGRFAEAVELQREIAERAAASGRPNLRERAERKLRTYESGRACRAPWLHGGDCAG